MYLLLKVAISKALLWVLTMFSSWQLGALYKTTKAHIPLSWLPWITHTAFPFLALSIFFHSCFSLHFSSLSISSFSFSTCSFISPPLLPLSPTLPISLSFCYSFLFVAIFLSTPSSFILSVLPLPLNKHKKCAKEHTVFLLLLLDDVFCCMLLISKRLHHVSPSHTKISLQATSWWGYAFSPLQLRNLPAEQLVACE